MPLLADPQAHVLYPPAIVFRLLPFPEAFGWFLAIHAVLATVGMAVFLRGRGLTTGAAATGAIGFGLGAHPTLLLAVPPALCGYAWLPWVATASARLADRPNRREAAGLAVALGWLLLAGSPPYARRTPVRSSLTLKRKVGGVRAAHAAAWAEVGWR